MDTLPETQSQLEVVQVTELKPLDEVAVEPPTRDTSVGDVILLENKGTWNTKAGGTLTVEVRMDENDMRSFFNYSPEELALLGPDSNVMGFRFYKVDVPKGGAGGDEFHRVRSEIVTCSSGEVKWTFADTSGKQREVVLKKGQRLLIPPFLLHSYEALEESSMEVFASTNFDPENKRTHDTYTKERFEVLSQKVKAASGLVA